VAVGPFDQKGDGFGSFDLFDESVFFFAEGVLVDEPGPTEYLRSKVVYGVLSDTARDEL
jgi:hypothetical protein